MSEHEVVACFCCQDGGVGETVWFVVLRCLLHRSAGHFFELLIRDYCGALFVSCVKNRRRLRNTLTSV